MSRKRIVLELDGDTVRLNGKLDRTKRKAQGIGDAFMRGAGGLGAMATKIGGIFSVTSAVSLAWGAIADDMERAQRAGQGLREAVDAISRAQGLAAGNAFQAVQTQGARAQLETGFGLTAQRAAEVAEKQASIGGLTRSGTNLLGKLSVSGQGPIGQLEAAGRISGLTGLGIEDLLERQSFAGLKSETTGDVIGVAAAQTIAGGALEVGGSVNEVLAILGAAKGDEAARLRTGLSEAARGLNVRGRQSGITEGTMLERMAQALALGDEQAQKILGASGITAARIATSQGGLVTDLQARLDQGVGGTIDRIYQSSMSNPLVASQVRLRRAEAEERQQRYNQTIRENQREAAILEQDRTTIFGFSPGATLERTSAAYADAGAGETAARAGLGVLSLGGTEAFHFLSLAIREGFREVALAAGYNAGDARAEEQMSGEPE